MDAFPELTIVPLADVQPYEIPADARVERVKAALDGTSWRTHTRSATPAERAVLLLEVVTGLKNLAPLSRIGPEAAIPSADPD